jgi:hypothetical protein
MDAKMANALLQQQLQLRHQLQLQNHPIVILFVIHPVPSDIALYILKNVAVIAVTIQDKGSCRINKKHPYHIGIYSYY